MKYGMSCFRDTLSFIKGNPCSLLENYRSVTVIALPELFALDDLEITCAERTTASNPRPATSDWLSGIRYVTCLILSELRRLPYHQSIEKEVLMKLTVDGMTGLSSPPPTELKQSMEPDEPPDEYSFYIELRLGQHQKVHVTTDAHTWLPEVIDFGFETEVQCVADVGLRDSFLSMQ